MIFIVRSVVLTLTISSVSSASVLTRAEQATKDARAAAISGWRKAKDFEAQHRLVERTKDAATAGCIKTKDAAMVGYERALELEQQHQIGAKTSATVKSGVALGARKMGDVAQYVSDEATLRRAWSSVMTFVSGAMGAVASQYRLAKSVFAVSTRADKPHWDAIVMASMRIFMSILLPVLVALITHALDLWNVPCLVAKEPACASIIGASASCGLYVGSELGKLVAGVYYLRRARLAKE